MANNVTPFPTINELPVNGREVYRRLRETQDQLPYLFHPEPLGTDIPEGDAHALMVDAYTALMRAQWALGRLPEAAEVAEARRPKIAAPLIGIATIQRQTRQNANTVLRASDALLPKEVKNA